MFDRSRYNWAATQVETCLKFDFGADDAQVVSSKEVLELDSFFSDVKRAKNADKLNWYAAIGLVSGQTLADLHSADHQNVPISISLGLINAAAAAMVMTKAFGVPQAQVWIDEQMEQFGVVKSTKEKTAGLSDSDSAEESPFPNAFGIVTDKFHWEDEDVAHYSEESNSWTSQGAYELAQTFEIDEELDHIPWELHPLMGAAMHIARHAAIQAVREDMRSDLDEGAERLSDIGIVTLMVSETSELECANKYLELVEATFGAMDLEWDERLRDNAQFFAKNLDKAGITDAMLKEHMTSQLREESELLRS